MELINSIWYGLLIGAQIVILLFVLLSVIVGLAFAAALFTYLSRVFNEERAR